MLERTYLDWNATAPLRPEARAAMIDAMEQVGNPSSVHAEGRAATAIREKARRQVAEALGALASDVVFTSGTTEAAALALAGRDLAGSEIEHEAVRVWLGTVLPCAQDGSVVVLDPQRSTVQAANSETGILQELPEGLAVSDLTQAFGKIPFGFDWSGISMGLVSAHKLGGPKGIGALVLRKGLDIAPRIKGGGQELGRRAGTENLVGIAGFGAAAEAAARDLDQGVWKNVEKIRNILETTLEAASKETIFVGNGGRRLPNTVCAVTPGWKGETQVMQMDLSGFAVSAGSACSSGKVRGSEVLMAMGFDATEASCALRVSIGPQTTEDQVMRFAETWEQHYHRHRARAA